MPESHTETVFIMFTPDQIQQLRYGYLQVEQTYFKLMSTYLSFNTKDPKSREYIVHGFLRRVSTLRRCIQNVYSIYPPDRSDIPSRKECVDLAINLQSLVFNVFGSIDNLAWIWATEEKLTTDAGGSLRPRDISFKKKLLRETLPSGFLDYLDSLKDWFSYMEDFRHALAHRIPLYVPPYTVTPANIEKHDELEKQKNSVMGRGDFEEYERLNSEQVKLGRFTPAMTHSHTEAPGSVAFHAQVLADWNTVGELADKFLEQLNSLRMSPMSA